VTDNATAAAAAIGDVTEAVPDAFALPGGQVPHPTAVWESGRVGMRRLPDHPGAQGQRRPG